MKKTILIITIVIFCLAILSVGAYFVGEFFAYRYVNKWADKLIELDEQGQLSSCFGAAWADILKEAEMQENLEKISKNPRLFDLRGERVENIEEVDDTADENNSELQPLQSEFSNYPSLKIVAELNKIPPFTSRITINDRNGLRIAQISTDHARVPFDSLPGNLITAIVAAEDKTFFTNNYGFDFNSFTRAIVRAVLDFPKTGKFRPKGTSTITQQVAKMLVSQLNDDGQRVVARNVDRKLQEIRIAGALRKLYTPEEIMEVYFNHCITSSYGLVGIQDIATQLWGKSVSYLTDAEAVYVSRMVKWGMNYPQKIRNQCRIDMPRIQKAFAWSDEKTAEVLEQIDKLAFAKPKQIVSENEHLIDLANIYWLKYLEKKGHSSEESAAFDILNSTSLVRMKGNLIINTTIDLPLQKTLDSLVATRGFGTDTINGVEKKQYYAYSIIDSKTGKMLAYSSLDKIGSRASALLSRSIPNGSAVAKPILNALMFDLEFFAPNAKFDDSKSVTDSVPWQREVRQTSAYFKNSAVKNQPYKVQNSGKKLSGEHFIFDLLTSSNNILAVETLYRLNAEKPFDENGNITDEGFALGMLFYRLGILDEMQKKYAGKSVTGVQVYKEIARIVGAKVDNIPDKTYSVALGTLELTLLEQIHLYNLFHGNKLIQNPKENPSLFIDEIILHDETFHPRDIDTVVTVRLFSDLEKIAPSALAMHNRLAGKYDGLSKFDIQGEIEWPNLPTSYSNIAKSGTADDIIQSYNNPSKKTNYCLWNAVLRIDFGKFGSANGIGDITVACVGEGNEKNTGPADGKSMHKYLTAGLLKIGGLPQSNGFYKNYDDYLRNLPEVEDDDEDENSDEITLQSLEEIVNSSD